MGRFDTLLTEELVLLEIDQLAVSQNIYWLLLEAATPWQQANSLSRQMKAGELDLKTAQAGLSRLLNSVDFGDWDVMGVKQQWQNLLQAHQAGKIDAKTLDRRLKEIKRDAFLYNTVFAIGRALYRQLTGNTKANLGQAFRREGLNQKEYDTNRQILNWQPTTANLQNAKKIARQLVDLVGPRQALTLLKQAA